MVTPFPPWPDLVATTTHIETGKVIPQGKVGAFAPRLVLLTRLTALRTRSHSVQCAELFRNALRLFLELQELLRTDWRIPMRLPTRSQKLLPNEQQSQRQVHAERID
jgi:hypothetical protein